MKNLQDLINLITKEIELSQDKYSKYTGEINFEYGYVSFTNICKYDKEESEKKDILRHFTIDTPAKIQQAYWTVWNSGRSQFEDHEFNTKL